MTDWDDNLWDGMELTHNRAPGNHYPASYHLGPGGLDFEFEEYMGGLCHPQPHKATRLKLSPPSQVPGLGQMPNARDYWLWLPIQKPQPTAVPTSVISTTRGSQSQFDPTQEPRLIGVHMPFKAPWGIQSLGKVVQEGNLR